MPSKIAIAEHLLNTTYPALQDPKILISVLQNTLDAIEEGITACLERAREEKRMPAYSDTLNGKLTAFKMHLAREHDIGPMDFMFIGELQELLAKHQSAPMEFRRKQSFVIADEDYNMRSVTPEKTKTYIARAKSLLNRL